jgi:hypothetical protein
MTTPFTQLHDSKAGIAPATQISDDRFKDRRAVERVNASIFGAVAGHMIGWFLAFCWLAASNNLMMRKSTLEKKRRALNLVVWSIVGTSTAIGVIVAWKCQRPEASKQTRFPRWGQDAKSRD